MAWLFFAFSGPVLWAISTHFDKYLVERYFKHNDVAVLLLFTALMGLLTLPFIAYYEPTVFEPSATSIALIVARRCFTCTPCNPTRPRWWRRFSRRCRCSATGLRTLS